MLALNVEMASWKVKSCECVLHLEISDMTQIGVIRNVGFEKR